MGLRSTSLNGQEKGVEGEEELMGGFVELRWKVVESEGELGPFLAQLGSRVILFRPVEVGLTGPLELNRLLLTLDRYYLV